MKIIKIIVEGPDCSGKSTLIERLKNKLKWDSKSLHHKEGNQFQRYLHEYAFADKVIFDRGHISEKIYSQIWRGGNPFNKEEESVLDYLLCCNSLVIFACPYLKSMRERYKQRGFEQQIKFEELEKSRELFIKAMKRFPDKLVYASSSYDELNKLVVSISSRIK